jgi:hypothetical protein
MPISFNEKEPSPRPPEFVEDRRDWKEVIGGIVALLLPFIILVLHWLWKNL